MMGERGLLGFCAVTRRRILFNHLRVRNSCFSAEMLTEIAERFDDLETELWRVKRAIEQRAKGDDA
jgi:hypothetical protein